MFRDKERPWKWLLRYIKMKNRTYILHTAQLKNNCPICFGNDGLEFTFTQKEKENAFLKKPDSEIERILYCHNCKSTIYPVDWTEDIELVYAYNKKLAETKRHVVKVKPLLYFSIIFGVILVGAGVYFLLN